MGLKDVYYSIEEKWYAFWDKVDKYVPVYKVIDPIDAVIPSLVLFLILIFLLIGFLAFFLISSHQVYDAKFVFVSSTGELIKDTIIEGKIFEDNGFKMDLNQRTDSGGEIIYSNLKKGSRIDFDVNLAIGNYEGSFIINKELDERVKLNAPKVVLSPVTKRIYARLQTGQALTNDVELKFSCESSTLTPTPTSVITRGEEIQVTEPVGCILKATVNDSKFVSKSYYVNSTSYDLFLEKPIAPTTKLIVKIREDGFLADHTNFKVKVVGEQTYEASTLSSSEATINLVSGSYSVTVSDSSGNYGLTTRNVEVTSTTELIVGVTKAVKSKVVLTLRDKDNSRIISGGIINITNSLGKEVYSTTSDSNGIALITFTDLDEYTFGAKKLGDINGGYFANSVTYDINSDKNITLELEKITKENIGRVKIRVVDQDDLPLINARVMLKFVSNEGIVELMQEKNYSLTDVNGEATFLAGKIDESVVAYAIKSPFSGVSTPKKISLEGETEFLIRVEVGDATIKINLFNELNEKLDGTIQILTTDGIMSNEQGLTGITSVEDGKVTRSVKAGQTIYVLAKTEDYVDYYSIPVTLWPNKTYSFDIKMKKQLLEPKIIFDKIYNETDKPVNTLSPGKKYYAKLFVESDEEYNNLVLHFRAGKESNLENDVIAIDLVEAANIVDEVRGVTFTPEEGYDFDFFGLTTGLAKWVNVGLVKVKPSIREVRVWFKVSQTATPNKEIVFYYRAEFDEIRKPESSVVENLYSDAYETNVYYVGSESTCEDEFCANNEWLYSKKDELYVEPPFELKQVSEYEYSVSLFNNSIFDYGRNHKPIYLSFRVVGDASDEKKLRINNYNIRDSVNTLTNSVPITSVNNLELTTFEKNSSINVKLGLEGLKAGAETIVLELKSEGRIIYTKEINFGIVKEKDFVVNVSPQFIPAMINTQIEVIVFDEKGVYLPGAIVNSYAKEPGFVEYLVTSTSTDRMGKAIVESGALFDKAGVIIEVIKEGYARQKFFTMVTDNTVIVAPEEVIVLLNTFTKKEEIKKMSLTNLTKQNLRLKSISIDAKYKDYINEDALKAYLGELTSAERTIPAEKEIELDLLRIRLANGVSEKSLIEPITITGTIQLVFEEPKIGLLYYKKIPITINISTDANPSTECIMIRPTGKTTLTTEKAQVRFDFEVINACQTDGVDIELSGLSVSSTSNIQGVAEISLSSTTGTSAGRTALDGAKRELLKTVPAGAKMYGVITFVPSEEAVGKSVQLPLSIEAKFQNQTVKSNPTQITFTTNVINLRECLSISPSGGVNEFSDRAKIQVDASKCLNQIIDVILCRDDSGCSGGVEGKITLSKKTFTIQNKSEEIEVYGPSIPGTYGVTVHARTRGSTGFEYIGEIPVTFIEQENKIFKLNKYELLLQGEGAMDAILLENNMLTQSVRVKANGCVWGVKNPGTDWMKVLTGATIGATLGSLVGRGFQTNPDTAPRNAGKDKSTTTAGPTTPGATPDSAPAEKGFWGNLWEGSWAQKGWDSLFGSSTPPTGTGSSLVENKSWWQSTKDFVSNVGSTVWNYTGGAALSVADWAVGGVVGVFEGIVNLFTGSNEITWWDSFKGGAEKFGNWIFEDSWIGFLSDKAVMPVVNGIGTVLDGAGNWLVGGAESAYNWVTGTTPTSQVSGGSGYAGVDESTINRGADYSNDGFTAFGDNSKNGVSELVQARILSIEEVSQIEGLYYYPSHSDDIYTITTDYSSSSDSGFYDVGVLTTGSNGENVHMWIGTYKDGEFLPTVPNTEHPTGYETAPYSPPQIDQKATSAHFAIWAGHQQGWITLAGAVIGGVLAYMDQDFSCSDQKYDQIVGYTDYVINLQGGEASTSDLKGNTVTRQIPSDAGTLNFTLEEVYPEWDFSDAYYAGTENVAIKFTNNGLDEAQPKYGTLLVNATRHTHGYDPAAVASGVSTGSNTQYDVLCKNNTFSNYWIGSGEEEGSCSGVSQSNYSQKFHIRIISSDPKGEDAYVRKYSSCYMGSLTGSTGEEALPRIKLDWDWSSIKADTCDYTNPDYVYCDGAQFLIALTKKLANLDEFLRTNEGGFSCPPKPLKEEVEESIREINSRKNQLMTGRIGVSEIELTQIGDNATAKVKIGNLTDSPKETMISYAWKGEGETQTGMQMFTAPIGETTITFGPVELSKYDGVYYFTAVVNGDYGDRIPVTRAFTNFEEENECWIEQSTQRTGGVPNLIHYVSEKDVVNYTSNIRSTTDLYNNINFAVYLTREAYTEDLFSDFKEYYTTTAFQALNYNPIEKAIVDYLTSGNFKITKRFSGDNIVEPGLYEVYVNISSPDSFRVIDEENTKISVELLLVKVPSTDSPFYRIPFDGMLGEKGNGRQGYGASYNNPDSDLSGLVITDGMGSVRTFDSAVSNGVTVVETVTKTTFEEVNVAPGTRGQIASVSVNNNNATLKLTPIYATPILGKVVVTDSKEGKMAYSVSTARKAIITGGNISYWTGAAKTKNFFGGNAIDAYQDSPDYRLTKLGDNMYGFTFNDVSRTGSMILKTISFVPAENELYILEAGDNSTTFWTPNDGFTPVIQLGGIDDMSYNSLYTNSKIDSLQKLFGAVSEGKVCVSNDGASTSFWWNPSVLETIEGSNSSMTKKELELIGTN